MPEHTQPTTILLSVGSNYLADIHIPIILECIEREFCVVSTSHPLKTTPINLPYPSPDFINMLICVESLMNLEEVVRWSKSVELTFGRTESLRRVHPERIPLDIDIILWGETLLRPQDLQRYYMPRAFKSMGMNLIYAQGKYSLMTIKA